jgi:hypothetical protein
MNALNECLFRVAKGDENGRKLCAEEQKMASDFAMDARKGPVIALCCVEGSNLYINTSSGIYGQKRGLPASFCLLHILSLFAI